MNTGSQNLFAHFATERSFSSEFDTYATGDFHARRRNELYFGWLVVGLVRDFKDMKKQGAN